MGVRPTQLTENRKNRLAKLFRILTCQMCRSDTHSLAVSSIVERVKNEMKADKGLKNRIQNLAEKIIKSQRQTPHLSHRCCGHFL